MVEKLVTVNNLDEELFHKDEETKKIGLIFNNDLHQVTLKSGFMEGATGGKIDGWKRRRSLLVSQFGFGILHLDIMMTGPYVNIPTDIATIPENAPAPVTLIEYMLFDGSLIWIGPNQRIIRANLKSHNQRYIAHIAGFFA